MSVPTSKIEEIIDTTQDSDAQDDSDDNIAVENEHDDAEHQQGPSSSTASSSKKKKKKRSKAAKALNALTGKSIPQALVDQVLDTVKAEGGEGSEQANAENVRQVLEHMKIMEIVKGKAGLGGLNKKDMGEHKFWSTQPVPQLGEGPPEEDGYIEPSKPADEVRQEPYPLPKDFEWSIIDITDPAQATEVHELLSLHYVEDGDATFRFKYSTEFLQWALQVPGYRKEWHVGVRVKSNKKLVGFISGVPMLLRVRKNKFMSAEINYLCVHKKLRSKRLAPLLIKEVTRQIHLKGIFQAIYTAGVVVPTPVSTTQYQHRNLNVTKLIDIQFSFVPRNMTLARMIRLNQLPNKPQLPGIREMTEKDIPQVTELYARYMERFDMVPVMDAQEIKHQFLSGAGKAGTGDKWRREGQVVWAYVVEDQDTHKISDYMSFYSLPSTVINHPKHGVLEAAYLHYYASDTGANADEDSTLKERLQHLIGDALIVANNAKFDVFNALTMMDNSLFLKELRFAVGNGFLNFYLYNWRTAPLAGMKEENGVPVGRGIGVVMV
ncbi:N-myristoyl transferase [Lentinula edodes]|uniref:N-myristoyl transferase n=1 Tax=Lentinula edodes TaxID=5353 RepID=UPI001E8D94FD|nr:N-myristoyl transferase [Lentinula edodes]KAH7871732.1 N-myristoyl transferase [Lentinula edodes]